MINKEKTIEDVAREYVEGGLKHYARVTTDLIQGLSVEDRIRVLTNFGLEVAKLLREHRERKK